MDYKYSCVIDSEGFYKEFVIVDTIVETDPETGHTETVESVSHYTMQEGENLIDCECAPLRKVHAEADGFIKPKWDGTEWVEGATEEEIAEWNEEHPAPEIPDESEETEEVTIDDMAEAIMEGVNNI